ncbi:MAG TPA: hypothetical protein VEI01_21905 [Terriglobales bacterium]|nr:hypothetical protein [Terriglobales bacterium]
MKYLLQVLLPAVIFALVPVVHAQKTADITQFGHDIHVQPDQKVGDLTCFNCSIYVRGQVAGDVTAILGRILIDADAQVAGDATTIGGDIRIGHGAKIAGDLTAVAGSVSRPPDASVAGDVTSLGGMWWLVLIFGTPLILLGLVIAVIVWLLRRGAAPAPVRA